MVFLFIFNASSTLVDPVCYVLSVSLACRMLSVVDFLQAHPYFYPVRNAESSRTRSQ